MPEVIFEGEKYTVVYDEDDNEYIILDRHNNEENQPIRLSNIFVRMGKDRIRHFLNIVHGLED